MDLDRQSIERRDFPIGRRGYDPAAVDAHLRVLATAVEELGRSLDSREGETLGSAAGTQVQSILEAAEATAAEIERQATEEARDTRRAAAQDAERTRSEAVARAQAHVQAVSQATAVLLERVESMDSEVTQLVQSLRAGAGRLAADLGAVETNMGELYDAASGGGGGGVGEVAPVAITARAPEPPPAPSVVAGVTESAPLPMPERGSAPSGSPSVSGTSGGPGSGGAPVAAKTPANGSLPAAAVAPGAEGRAASGGQEDLDGARLIALNMALNGEPREQADRYLAENFRLADREKLLDEVYAAIEG